MSFTVYHNPYDVNLAGPVTGVVAVAVGQSFGEVHAAADADVHETVAGYAAGRVTGSISLVDPTQAQALSGRTGTLTFKWKDAKGGAAKVVTVANCSITGWKAAVSRGAASSAVVGFVAESAPVIA
jgi:hypothetical protein